MDYVEAMALKKCEIDAFLNCNCKLSTVFGKDLVDVEKVEVIHKREFQYLEDFEFQAKDPKDYLISRIKFDKFQIKKLKLIKSIVESKNKLNFFE